MCGIVGALALGDLPDKKAEKIRQDAMIFLSTELLQVTQERGKDAAGISTMFTNGDYMLLKMGVSAMELIGRFGGTEKDFDGYMKIWRENTKPARLCIGHCRKPSTGGGATAYDNENNHPIRVGEIVGVHNGTLKNHYKIQRLLEMKPDGKVDSEAIMQLLNHFSEDGTRPFTTDMVNEVCRRLEGQFAVLAYSGNNPHQLVMFRDGRPIEICLIKPLNMILIASEKKFLNTVFFRWNKMAKLYGHKDYPMLTTKDLDFLLFQDEQLAVFDLRHTIEEKALMIGKDADLVRPEDFYEAKKLLKADKIWENAMTATTGTGVTTGTGNTGTTVGGTAGKTHAHAGYTPVGGGTKVGNNSSGAEVNALPAKSTKPKTDDKNTGESMGRVFCKQLGAYRDVIVREDTKNVGAVEVDPKDGEVTEIPTNTIIVQPEIEEPEGKQQLDLEEDRKGGDLIDDPAKVNEIIVNEMNKETFGDDGDAEDPQESDTKSVEIDMTVDPDAIEAASEATEALERYENDEEVSGALETTASNLKALPLYSLANRMKRIFYRIGFLDGYKKATAATKELPALDRRADEKMLKQRKNLRVLKHMTNTIMSILGNNIADNRVSEAVGKTLRDGHRLESAPLEKIFTESDKKNHQLIVQVIDNLKRREADQN